MAERIVKRARWSRIKRALKSGEVGEAGHVACIDLDDGALVRQATDGNLFPIGTFDKTFTGDGTRVMSVTLFSEIELILLANQATGQVADANMCALCYLHGTNSEVSMTATSKSLAGRVWGLEGTTGVWVQPMPAMGPTGPQGPEGT